MYRRVLALLFAPTTGAVVSCTMISCVHQVSSLPADSNTFTVL